MLYAPTWRDREFYLPGAPPAVLELDVDRMLQRLGPGHVLLTRLHPKMTDRAAGLDRPGVVDVSRHPEVHELYLAADVLVTDYSSVMFDFAITGRPIIFYAYDLDRFRARFCPFEDGSASARVVEYCLDRLSATSSSATSTERSP